MKRLWIIAFLLMCLGASAQQVITATLTVTNIYGTTNGEQITLNGTTWTITNNVQNNVQILYGTNTVLAASNIYTGFFLNPPSKVILAWPASTNIVTFQCYPGAGLTASINSSPSNWATLTFTTNTASSGTIVVRIPASVEGAPMQTNIGSQIEQYLEQSTNAYPQTNTFASNLVGLTNTQTITGAKTLTGVTILSNSGDIFYLGTISNALLISGNIYRVTNGYWTNAILDVPIFTNAINYGNALSSVGSGGGAEQFGVGATATASFATALGGGAAASGTSATALGNASVASAAQATAAGNGAQATKIGSSAFGLNATANGINSTALGVSSSAGGFTNSTAVGYLATATAANQIMLGSAGVSAVVNNYLNVLGGMTVGNGVTNLAHWGTNYFAAGSDVSFGRFPITTLANGNNAGVIVGTNVFCDVSGPSGAFTINGLTGSPNRDGKVVIIKNATGQTMTIANESGVDAVAGNRIKTGFSADQSYTNNPGMVTLIYDGSLSRWIIQSHN